MFCKRNYANFAKSDECESRAKCSKSIPNLHASGKCLEHYTWNVYVRRVLRMYRRIAVWHRFDHICCQFNKTNKLMEYWIGSSCRHIYTKPFASPISICTYGCACVYVSFSSNNISHLSIVKKWNLLPMSQHSSFPYFLNVKTIGIYLSHSTAFLFRTIDFMKFLHLNFVLGISLCRCVCVFLSIRFAHHRPRKFDWEQ